MKIAILYGPRDLRIEEQPLDTDNLKPDEIWVETSFGNATPRLNTWESRRISNSMTS